MATHPDDSEDLKTVNQKLREALKDCHELLDRSRELLHLSSQDNDPPSAS